MQELKEFYEKKVLPKVEPRLAKAKEWYLGHKKPVDSIGIFLIIVLLGAGVFIGTELPKDRIHPGISVGGVDVSKLTKKEAEEKLSRDLTKELEERTLRLKSDVTSYRESLKSLGFYYDVKEGVQEAYEVGRSGNPVENGLEVLKAVLFKENLESEPKVNGSVLRDKLEEIGKKVFVEAVDAKFSYNGENVEVSNERQGTELLVKETARAIKDFQFQSDELQMEIKKVEPKLKKADFEGINGVIATFSTKYGTSEKNRKYNIALGAERTGNLLVKAGEEVSFNDTVGEITTETGFKDAGVILNGEFDRGVGGGICQVSTTMYNALLLANVDITERHNHSRPIGYVKRGTDAAVVWGYKDMKFRNTLDTPIYITAEATGSTLTYTIYGDAFHRDYTVEIVPKLLSTEEPKVVKRTSSKIPEGVTKVEKQGSTGYFYKTYKNILRDGEVVKSDVISKSNYYPQKRVVIIGTGESGDKDQSTKKERTKKEKNDD